jgi:replication factor C subunit 3/5
MEKYMSKCRLILVCENIGRLITPLKSRCLGVRLYLYLNSECHHLR